ncbi:MAG: homoserine O-acetyltransferase [Coriobacteriia bacterium]|nr:homoserine O-acetyltransferase [Coriobacteriia bacterium]
MHDDSTRQPWEDVGSIGVVPERALTLKDVTLVSGRTLAEAKIAYETYGGLSEARDNAILLFHALSGDAHAAGWREKDALTAGWKPEDGPDWVPSVAEFGDPDAAPASRIKPGWWDPFVGPGKAFDTNRYFIICANVLGGCLGTTGPSSIDPETGKPYGLSFPVVTIEDMVDVQARLLDELGIDRLLAVVGGSMGGMQALAFARRYPDRVATCLAIATTWRLTAQAIAFNEVGRTAILGDPAFNGGDYYDGEGPLQGLAVARMIGHITYLSDESMRKKFGRRLRDRKNLAFDFVTEFEVESYLAYQGKRFTERFDANSYLYMTKAMDYFDLSRKADSLPEALAGTPVRYLVMSFSSDWLFPTYQSQALVDALKSVGAEVSFVEIPSPYGHDAFLLEPEAQYGFIRPFLAWAMEERRASEKRRAGGQAWTSGQRRAGEERQTDAGSRVRKGERAGKGARA